MLSKNKAFHLNFLTNQLHFENSPHIRKHAQTVQLISYCYLHNVPYVKYIATAIPQTLSQPLFYVWLFYLLIYFWVVWATVICRCMPPLWRRLICNIISFFHPGISRWFDWFSESFFFCLGSLFSTAAWYNRDSASQTVTDTKCPANPVMLTVYARALSVGCMSN